MQKYLKINEENIDLKYLNEYIIGTSTKIDEYFKGVKPFVDLVVTSPPYYDAKVYSTIEHQIGYNQTYDEYLEDIRKTFIGVTKICKKSASLYLNLDTVKRDKKMYRLPDDIAKILEKLDWIHQDTIIWDKVKTLPYSRKGQSRNVFEYILLFTRDKSNFKYYEDRIKVVQPMHWWVKHPEKYSPKGISPSNIWTFSIPPQGSWGSKVENEKEILKHVCPFPPELMARIIKLSSNENDVVFDPYAGTGILLATAEKLNRRFLGIDISEDSKDIFENATQKFVDSRWEEIQGYYAVQEYLKPLYWKTIINLRILKYIKILMKKINESDVIKLNYDNIVSSLAIKQQKNDENRKRKKYGKARYIIFYKGENITEEEKDHINKIINKKPLSKYSLITDVEFVNVEELDEIVKITIKEIDTHLYIYEEGETTNYTNLLNNPRDIKKIFDKQNSNNVNQLSLGNNSNTIKTPKSSTPLIISNVDLAKEDYEILLDETKPEEKPKKYSKIAKQYNLI